ncbi:MAG: hypothetical protein P1V36_01740 [Planctomycetota bacterium]|nr:hypothetical protein [Planctomycetota bacterium]
MNKTLDVFRRRPSAAATHGPTLDKVQRKRSDLEYAIDQFDTSTRERHLASQVLNDAAAEYARHLSSTAVARLDGLPVTADDEAYGIRLGLASEDALRTAQLRESEHKWRGDEMLRAVAELTEARREALCASTVEEGA